jgi:hypothetical protein
MKPFLLLAVIIAAILLPAQAADNTVNYTVRIVYVQPAGETFTAEERAYAYQSVQAAAVWWEELSPITTTLDIVDTTEVLSPSFDVYAHHEQLFAEGVVVPAVSPGEMLLFIVDNSTSRRELTGGWGSADGLGYYRGAVLVVNTGEIASLIAHEFGHALYDLEDLYIQPRKTPAGTLDIMDYTVGIAFQQKTIGCTSLAALGKPCAQVYLPVVRN